jgi:hypothetical protein
MYNLSELGEKIKTLKTARDILQQEYSKTYFHKKKEENPNSTVPAKPGDKDVYKLLIAIQQLESYIKKLQDEQFELIKKENNI